MRDGVAILKGKTTDLVGTVAAELDLEGLVTFTEEMVLREKVEQAIDPDDDSF